MWPCRWFPTRHGPVGLAHVLLREDEANESDAAVHQPHQETRGSKDLIAGRKGGHIAEDDLKEQACGGGGGGGEGQHLVREKEKHTRDEDEFKGF